MLMDLAITLHSPCKTCIHPPGASQCDPANWRFCSCSLVAMGKSDAATQWTKSFGGQQESPTQWLKLVQKQWLEITSLLQLHYVIQLKCKMDSASAPAKYLYKTIIEMESRYETQYCAKVLSPHTPPFMFCKQNWNSIKAKTEFVQF